MPFDIREPKNIQEFKDLEKLQMDIWQEDVFEPGETLFIIHKNGGVVLSAYDPKLHDSKPIGFVFGLLGREPTGELKHASHMLGILAAYRDKKLGEALKWAQRERILAQGLKRMTWTYDPLESRNAYLNLHKLGAVCRRYYVNLYGDMGGINQGLPSDRFEVDWHVSSHRVEAKQQGIYQDTDVKAACLNPNQNLKPCENP
ncbi:MAG: hypothetical protein R2865_10205 [Deinococcales bacterium]